MRKKNEIFEIMSIGHIFGNIMNIWLLLGVVTKLNTYFEFFAFLYSNLCP